MDVEKTTGGPIRVGCTYDAETVRMNRAILSVLPQTKEIRLMASQPDEFLKNTNFRVELWNGDWICRIESNAGPEKPTTPTNGNT
jgi:hypothetical protein